MIELRSPAEIEQMKPAGRFVAAVLTRLEEAADVASTCSSSTPWRTT